MKYLTILLLLINVGFTQDIESLKEKASIGDAKAQNDLGVAYFEGKYIEKNYAEAKKWYELSAQQNLDFAQHNLGAMYLIGKGVPIDYVKAREWFELAANQGFRKSQLMLGFIYLNGSGVDKNINEAKKYFAKSCNQQLEDACLMYQLVVYQLTDNEKIAINTLLSSQLNFEFHNIGNSNLNYLGNYIYFDEYDLYKLFENNFLRAKNLLSQKNNISSYIPSFLVSLTIDSISSSSKGIVIKSVHKSTSDPYRSNVIEYEVPYYNIENAPKSFESLSKGDNIFLACLQFVRFTADYNHLTLGNCNNAESSIKARTKGMASNIFNIAQKNFASQSNNEKVVYEEGLPLAPIIVLANVLYASKLSNNFENIDVKNSEELNTYINQMYFVGDESFDRYKEFYEQIGLSGLNNFFIQE